MLEVSLPSSFMAYTVLCRNNLGAAYLKYQSYFAMEMALRGRKKTTVRAAEAVAMMMYLKNQHPEVYKYISENIITIDENFGEV